jgi:VWFA-related protein
MAARNGRIWKRTADILTSFVLAWGVSGGAQERPRDTFRTSIDLVELDVVASDGDGRPVLDLTASDFEILEDGRPVDIASFKAVRLPDSAPQPIVPSLRHPGAVWASNDRAADGRLIVILLDRIDRTRFQRAQQTVLALLERLGPADQVAMLSNGGSLDYQVEFTTDRSRIVRALDSRATLGQERRDFGAGSDKSLRVLTRLADALRPVTGRRKIVVLVSEGIPEIQRSTNFDEGNAIPELREFVTAALRANVSVYAFSPRYPFDLDEAIHAEDIDARSLQLEDESAGAAGLATVANLTGGRAAVRTNLFEPAVAQMVAESASYYLIAYYSRVKNDGKFHKISVRCRRPGLEVRTKSGFVAPKPASRAEPDARAVERLAAAPIQQNGLPLRFVAVAAPGRDERDSSVHVIAEVKASDVAAAGTLELKALAADAGGKVHASDRFAGRLQASAPPGDARWIRVGLSINLRPGRYNLRVAASPGGEGAGGSAFDEIEVTDFAKDLSVGALLLGTPGQAGTVRTDRIAQELGFVPIAARELPSGLEARAGVPVRVARKHRRETLRFVGTLAQPGGVRREIARREGPAEVFTAGATFSFDLPLEGAPPGDYDVTLDVSLGDRVERRSVSFRLLP